MPPRRRPSSNDVECNRRGCRVVMPMDLRPTHATTTAGTAGDGADAALLAWGLTVLWHPDPARVGERAVLAALDAGGDVALSRLEPSFAAPGGTARPLDDTRLSR